jgi:hypothetical protein
MLHHPVPPVHRRGDHSSARVERSAARAARTCCNGLLAPAFALAMIALVPSQLAGMRSLVATDGSAGRADVSVTQATPPPQPPAPPAPPAPPSPPVPPAGGVIGHTGDSTGSWWAYIKKADRIMAHAPSDDPRVAAIRQTGPVFWFVRDNREYVVRDEATLREVEAIVADVEAMGARQEELAAKPSASAAEKDALSKRLAAASDRMDREVAALIERVLADGRAKPLKTM